MKESSASSPLPSALDETSSRVWLPRWVIYAQATLLGLATVVAFIFGVMVGQITAPTDRPSSKLDCSVRGSVLLSDGAGDVDAVVVLLPADAEINVRLDPESIAPANFKPLENPVIDQIHAWGGAITRTNARGEFAVQVDAPDSYWLVAVSRNIAAPGPLRLSRQEMAGIGKYFLPVEVLFRDRQHSIQTLTIQGTSQVVPPIQW